MTNQGDDVKVGDKVQFFPGDRNWEVKTIKYSGALKLLVVTNGIRTLDLLARNVWRIVE